MDDINKRLFCGWKNGRQWDEGCPAEPLLNEFVTAYDFKVCLAEDAVSPYAFVFPASFCSFK